MGEVVWPVTVAYVFPTCCAKCVTCRLQLFWINGQASLPAYQHIYYDQSSGICNDAERDRQADRQISNLPE